MPFGPRLPGPRPTRERVAELLRRAPTPLTTPQIVGRLGLSRPAVYKALITLEAEGRVARRRPPPMQQGDSWRWVERAAGAAD